VWNLDTNNPAFALEQPGAAVTQVAFSADGSYLAASGLDHTVKVWDATTGGEVARLDTSDGARAVAFSPDGSRGLRSITASPGCPHRSSPTRPRVISRPPWRWPCRSPRTRVPISPLVP
ncbi:MAG: hypothetical protein E6K70_11655, partial [Planctomycetota bacterium]